MSMIEVDTLLYMKCRLCVDESGIYQIVPAVRDQISYCFGIDVEPFDGLSQLICKKCQIVLYEYSKTKQTYIDKQTQLKKRQPETSHTQPVVKLDNSGDLNSLNSNSNSETENVKKKKNNKRRRLKSSSDESNIEHVVEPSRKVIKNTSKKGNKWKAKYQKTFFCRLCHSSWSSKRTVLSHRNIHQSLLTQYADVFSKHCTVVLPLPKIDDKPNLTGSNEHVVYSKNKIIAMGGGEDYYIAYKYRESEESSDDANSIPNHDNEVDESDCSSASNHIIRYNRARCSNSRSSTDTVVLAKKTNGKKGNGECINIDDSDSSDYTEETKEKKKQNKQKIDMIKKSAISKIISTSLSRYTKKHENIDKSTLDQLNRKITSIGRQIINRKRFNSNRLMKYIEHLNLNVIWLPRSPLSVTNNSNYYKIIPRSRYSSEKVTNDFEGYKKKYDKPNISNLEMEALDQELGETPDVEPSCSQLDPSTLVRIEAPPATNEQNKGKLQKKHIEDASQPINEEPNAEIDNALLCKLLNANPVANPKQLKKKSKLAINMPSLDPGLDVMSNYDSNMPIIANTTSLANIDNNENGQSALAETVDAPKEPVKPVTAPRIKVKSVESLNRMNEPPSIVTSNGVGNPQFAFYPPADNNNSDDYVILDTVELPNTKTSSPFSYFRTLLQMHNLGLLDTEATLSPEFNSLIRFKVLYKQENKEQPVILCLSLLCHQNTFCLKIKDRNDENINMSKVSSNWQWEILKIYKGDVVPKILANAKKIGPMVFESTNSFLCLLKSIKFITNDETGQ